MCSLIKSATSRVQRAMCKVQRAMLLAGWLLMSCSQNKAVVNKTFFNFDSLVDVQVSKLGDTQYELSKSVTIDGKNENTHFNPTEEQWQNELQIFKQLDALNKASFRDAYVISEGRDTNSNLNVREIKANRPVPVSSVKFYYLRNSTDLRRVEAIWLEENSLYTNARKMIIELEPSSKGQIVHRYSIEGSQKMVMDDSVKFVIAGEVTM